LPKHFAEGRTEVLHAAIQRAEFGTLVTLGSDGLIATHLPLLLEPEAGPLGALYGHVARANPQWRDHLDSVPALAIFLGPQAYVSPAWYATKRENGRVVPTWNYLAVHAYGPLRTYDDPSRLRAHVERLTRRQESGRTDPWHVGDAPDEYIDGMVKGIVGIELPIERLEGKWKMSQNRPRADRLGAIEGLESTGGPVEAAVAEVMRQLEPDQD
jgi:transcriptional regulator